ncbi:MAG TPA: hypothetical protein VH144_02570 [Candidatus Saccharimonadales bacterium]|jgi:hypothetical protein|nr:hypothetical protein [Candidatus Saccharimonadales bacterium]
MTTKLVRRIVCSVLACLVISVVGVGLLSRSTQAANGEFFLQVSPSPLVATLKPGQQTNLSLKIRNSGTQTEQLTIVPRTFTVSSTTGQVEFNDNTPPEMAAWVKFGAVNFSIDPGQTFEQKVTINVPKDAGFSYSFALLIKRQDSQSPQLSAGQKLKAQVAIFALLNVDRPGAIRALKIDKFTSDSNVYEYPPANFHINLRNIGNTIVQPSGNVFIQRSSTDQTPIATLAANDTSGYILPGTFRSLPVKWSDSSNQSLMNIRIGYYTAKAVVVYNDGTRDVPMVAEVGFWIIPWKILLGVLVVLVLVGLGFWTIISKVWKISRRNKGMTMRPGKSKK